MKGTAAAGNVGSSSAAELNLVLCPEVLGKKKSVCSHGFALIHDLRMPVDNQDIYPVWNREALFSVFV